MGGAGASLLLPLIVIGGMMFFMTRSQKKQQQQRQDLLNSMEVGSEVETIGGLHGIVSEFNEAKGTVILNCEGIFLEYNRAAISKIKPPTQVVNDDDVTVVEVDTDDTASDDTTDEDK